MVHGVAPIMRNVLTIYVCASATLRLCTFLHGNKFEFNDDHLCHTCPRVNRALNTDAVHIIYANQLGFAVTRMAPAIFGSTVDSSLHDHGWVNAVAYRSSGTKEKKHQLKMRLGFEIALMTSGGYLADDKNAYMSRKNY